MSPFLFALPFPVEHPGRRGRPANRKPYLFHQWGGGGVSLVFMMKVEFIKEDANVNVCITMLKIM